MAARRAKLTPSGYLLLDKPAGMSSQQAVLAVRRRLGYVRAGHAGTLDPFATGLLVIATGAATRLLTFVTGASKRYELSIQLGVVSDTDDTTGASEHTGSETPGDIAAVRAAVDAVTRRRQQRPPAVSAIHVDGERAYRRARRGEDVQAPMRDVEMWDVAIRGHDQARGIVDMAVSCSSGTYMRSLARDLGDELGCGGCAAGLRRTAVGTWAVDDAVAIGDIDEGVLQPALGLVADLPRVELDADQAAAIRHGSALPADDAGSVVDGSRVALVRGDDIVAVAERTSMEAGPVLQPRVVLGGPEPAAV